MHPITEDLVPVTQQADDRDPASPDRRPAADVDAGGQGSADGGDQNRQSIPLPPGARPRSQARRAATPPASEPSTGNGASGIDLDQLERRAPVRFSDSPRFSLEYELEAVGSRGVETVELWGSLDAGATWKRWGTDPDRTSPFDIETAGEGAYGFRSVVLGANGLISPSPLAGDTPDIVVVVDTTDPRVRLTGARYGEGDQVGSLVITYECTDSHLLQRPITLSFSDQPDGPWTTIAAGLRNRGEYVWPADPELPREIFLRIDATDRAGNVGTYILDQPIRTQGLAPRAKIRGFRATRAASPAAASAADSGRGDPSASREVDGGTVR